MGACSSVNNAIGGGALTVATAANLITAECGNTVPDGPCVPTSAISTTEKQGFKEDLQKAQVALQEAAALNRLGKAAQAQGKLAQADAILSAIERILIERGVN